MAKLILSLDGVVLREIKLDRDTTRIGRKPFNELQIDNLAVSGEHARLSLIGGDAFLEDLDSTNGTSINGQPIQRQMLKDEDSIEIGKYKLKYLSEAGLAAGRPQPDDLDKTMVIRADSLRPMPPSDAKAPDTVMELPAAKPAAALSPAATPAPAAPSHSASADLKPAAIKVLTGGNAGKSLDLVKNLTSLGKPGVQVAIITRRPTAYFLTHVEGPSRPLINGRQIGVQAEALNDHDVIELAGVKMEFFYK